MNALTIEEFAELEKQKKIAIGDIVYSNLFGDSGYVTKRPVISGKQYYEVHGLESIFIAEKSDLENIINNDGIVTTVDLDMFKKRRAKRKVVNAKNRAKNWYT